jgi:hypothetical protein
MKKTISLLAVSLFFAAFLSSSVYAATLKCTVDKVEGDVVTMTCADKAATLEVGTKVKVKTAKTKAAAIEGC